MRDYGTVIYHASYDSPLGAFILSSDGHALTGLSMQAPRFNQETLEGDSTRQELPVFAQARQWLDDYFAGKNPEIDFPLAPQGSKFRQSVWKILAEIPWGEVKTYGEIAKQISSMTGKNMAAQAVGGAVGHNSIPIIIPCHRVVGSKGNLTGYASGIDIKIALMNIENIDMDQFYRPTTGTAL